MTAVPPGAAAVVIYDGPFDLNNAVLHQSWPKVSRNGRLIRRTVALTAAKYALVATPVHVHFVIRVPESGRWKIPDADATAISAKHMLDGLVDAGVLPDDDGPHVEAVTYWLGGRVAGLERRELVCALVPCSTESDPQ